MTKMSSYIPATRYHSTVPNMVAIFDVFGENSNIKSTVSREFAINHSKVVDVVMLCLL